jgi:hypothetical protein
MAGLSWVQGAWSVEWGRPDSADAFSKSDPLCSFALAPSAQGNRISILQEDSTLSRRQRDGFAPSDGFLDQ